MEDLYSIEDVKGIANFPPTMVNGPKYMFLQRQLAKMHLMKNNELEAIYHLTESHSVGMRQVSLIQSIKTMLSAENKETCTETSAGGLDTSYLEFDDTGTSEGMLKRLRELPKEWSVIQLTREFDHTEIFNMRMAETSIQPKGFHVTRLPCGSNLEMGECPVTIEMVWPEWDFLKVFWDSKKNLGMRHGSAALTRKIRFKVSSDMECHLREIGPLCFKEWVVLLLGNLCDASLQSEIRSILDIVIDSQDCLSERQRYLCRLVAEGCCHLSEDEINYALKEVATDNKPLRIKLFETISEIKSHYAGKLMTAKRHPVILILDEHFEIIPWECLPVLRRHPVSRVRSFHFLFALFKLHQPYIRNGLREIADNDICYYIINPDGDLPSVEERLAKFLKTRLPHWVGIIGQKPTEEQLVEALTTKNTFVYCGHGSGCQYMNTEVIQKLKVRPVQMLYGCCSAGLKDHGGMVEMTGDVLQFTIAGSGCTLGMLWSVMSNDTDKMTMVLANTWFPGTPVDINTFEEIKDGSKSQEPELLRAMKEVRDCVELFSNGAAFIARGIPIVLVPAK